jgi:hypothetical protein
VDKLRNNGNDISKETRGGIVLHCKTKGGIMQEEWVGSIRGIDPLALRNC